MSQRKLMPSPAFIPVQDIFERLLHQTVTRVSIEAWSVRLLFETGELHIEGDWRLLALDGSVLDTNQELSARKQFELWRIVNGTVEDLQFCDEPLPRFTMRIADQWSLEVIGGIIKRCG